jgi:NAD(P)H-nitrite reductase large subunit
MEYVIIGNGVAGTTAAESIRKLDPKGGITMIGDESGLPYCRPMISMVLEGTATLDQLPIRKSDFHDALEIVPKYGHRVTAIDVDNHTVQIGTDQSVAYDRLLIATGADPRPIKAQNCNLKNISYMRTAAHVQTMLAGLDGAKKALVLGGGLVGFKAAYGLLRRGLTVTMLIRSGYPLSQQVDETGGQIILKELSARGLEVRVGVEVTAFEGRGKVEAAHVSDGSVIACDMVVIGKGVLPAQSFVPPDRIEVDLGIIVNANMQTTAPAVYAAGDVAEHIDVARNTPWVNAIWPEAVSQGRIAGINMAGRPVVYAGSLSRNVIRIFGLDVLSTGLVNPPDDAGYKVISAINARRNTYRKLVFYDQRLIGFTAVNEIEQGGVFIALVHNKIPLTITPETLLDPRFNFKQVMTPGSWAAMHRAA